MEEILEIDYKQPDLIKSYRYSRGALFSAPIVEINSLSYDFENGILTVLNGLYAEMYAGRNKDVDLKMSTNVMFHLELNLDSFPTKNDLMQVLSIYIETMKYSGMSAALASEVMTKEIDRVSKKILSEELVYLR